MKTTAIIPCADLTFLVIVNGVQRATATNIALARQLLAVFDDRRVPPAAPTVRAHYGIDR